MVICTDVKRIQTPRGTRLSFQFNKQSRTSDRILQRYHTPTRQHERSTPHYTQALITTTTCAIGYQLEIKPSQRDASNTEIPTAYNIP